MYQKQPKNPKRPIKHPHFVRDVGSGKQILSDAPKIQSEIDPEMFSLSVNKLNKQNLQPVTTELSNRLDAVHALEREKQSLENSIAEYQHAQQVEKDRKAFEEMMMKEENPKSN